MTTKQAKMTNTTHKPFDAAEAIKKALANTENQEPENRRELVIVAGRGVTVGVGCLSPYAEEVAAFVAGAFVSVRDGVPKVNIPRGTPNEMPMHAFVTVAIRHGWHLDSITPTESRLSRTD